METGIRTLTETDLYVTTATQQTQLGALGATQDGRQFRYVLAGASAVNPGQLVVAAAIAANSTGLAIPTQATNNLLVNSKLIVVTNGATPVVANQFAEGFVEVLGAGGGFAVRVAGSTAAAAGAAITLTLAEGLPSALVAGTNTVNLTASPYSGVITSLVQSLPIGVARVTIPASNYGWVQGYGHALVSSSTAVTKGQAIQQDITTTAGNIVSDSATTALQIGIAKESVAGAGFVPAHLNVI